MVKGFDKPIEHSLNEYCTPFCIFGEGEEAELDNPGRRIAAIVEEMRRFAIQNPWEGADLPGNDYYAEYDGLLLCLTLTCSMSVLPFFLLTIGKSDGANAPQDDEVQPWLDALFGSTYSQYVEITPAESLSVRVYIAPGCGYLDAS